jgi:lipoprotein NlpD
MSTNIRSNKVPFVLATGAQRRAGWLSRLALPCALTAAVLLAGCAHSSLGDVAVEDRNPQTSPPTAEVVRPLPGIENAGKPGYYTIKPGDTVFRIARENGQNVADIVRWNGIGNSNLIEVGQVIRIVPPGSSVSSGAAIARPAVPIPVEPPVASDESVNWSWPAQGALIAGFSEVKNKGLDIAGKAGDTVMASADGKVVYAGTGLRGYGNLIILKHNDTFLTAYAHNRALMVKEDQVVKKGQKIAEMGSTDTDRVKLHFEIRRQGKPVDPARYLPAR